MDSVSVLMALGAMCIGIGATLIVLGKFSTFFGPMGPKVITAGIITGLVGGLLMMASAMGGQRKQHTELAEPVYRPQPPGWQPDPGRGMGHVPSDGCVRPVPDQMPLPAPFGPGPRVPGAPVFGPRTFEVAGTFRGTAIERGGGGYGQGTLALESGAQRVAIGK